MSSSLTDYLNNPLLPVAPLEIVKVETKKSQIKQRQLMELDVIPKHAKILIFAGPAGSGKTTLVHNLLTKAQFYGPSFEGMKIPKGVERRHQKKPLEPEPYFDHVILLIGSGDDMYDDLLESGVINQRIRNPTVSQVDEIIRAQEELLAAADGNILKIPKLLVICDDLMANQKLLNSKAFSDLSIKNRHLNASVWYLSQYINLVPKRIREQASNTFIFSCTAQCQKVLMEQYREPGVSKNEFETMIKFATEIDDSGKRNFLHINKSAKHKFRKNLDIYLYHPGQEEPQTINLGVKEAKSKFTKVPKALASEAESKDSFPEISGATSTAAPPPNSDTKPTKSYLIGGRFIKFEI